MKILLTNLYLHQGTGSETFIYTLGKYLQNAGHQVCFFALFNGDFQKKLIDEGFECISHRKISPKLIIQFSDGFFVKLKKYILFKIYSGKIYNSLFPVIFTEKFDIIHFQHVSNVKILYNSFPHTAKIFMSHGVIPKEEQIPNFTKYPMNAYICVSEEVKKHCQKSLPKDFHSIYIIRNPIDLDYFQSKNKISGKLKNILVISKKILLHQNYIDIIDVSAKKIGAKVTYVGHPIKIVKNIKTYIEKNDLVIGIGRCIYEGMSMERNVIVLDYLGLDGFIESESDYLKLRENNLSGRYKNNTNFTQEDLMYELKKYDASLGVKNRTLIKKYNNIHVIGKEIITLYNKLLHIHG